MKVLNLTSSLMILSLLSQPIAYSMDAQAMSQAQIEFQENIQAAKTYAESRMQERFSALDLTEQRDFLNQSEKYLGRLERRLEKVSDRRFDRRMKRVTRVLEKKVKKQQLLAEETAEDGLVESSESELKGYWATYSKIMMSEQEAATVSAETKTRPERTLEGLKNLHGMNRVQALDLVESSRKSIGQLKVAINNQLNGTPANRVPAEIVGEGLLLLMMLFVFFIPTLAFIIVAIFTGAVIFWILACAAAVASLLMNKELGIGSAIFVTSRQSDLLPNQV